MTNTDSTDPLLKLPPLTRRIFAPEGGVGEDGSFNANGLRVALLYNLADNAPVDSNAPADALDELDHENNVAAYASALRQSGHTVFPMEGNADLPIKLKELEVDIAFNTCEGFRGDSREAQVPALLEMLGVPYTAAKVLSLALTLDKAMTKRILRQHGLATPRFQEFFAPTDTLDHSLRFPLFAKPNREGTGKGITEKSILHSETELREYVDYLLKTYRQTVLVEEYVDGRDLTCGLVGNLSPHAAAAPIPLEALKSKGDELGVDYEGVHFFPISEVDYTVYEPGTEPVYSNKLKVTLGDMYRALCPAPVSAEIAAEVRRQTLEVFRHTQSLDVARVDFRMDRRTGVLQILEINSLPGITPISDLTLCAEAEGWTHADLVAAVMDAAIRRHGLTPRPNQAVSASQRQPVAQAALAH